MTSAPTSNSIRSAQSTTNKADNDCPTEGDLVPADLESKLEKELEPYVDRPRLDLVVRKVEQVISKEVFAGPLPHPHHFAQYKEIEPTAPDRILRMAEKEQEFRHRMSSRSLNADVAAHFAGLAGGLLVCSGLIAGAVHLALNGQQTVALALLGASVLNLVGLFVNSTRKAKPPQAGGQDVPKDAPAAPKAQTPLPPKAGNRKRHR